MKIPRGYLGQKGPKAPKEDAGGYGCVGFHGVRVFGDWGGRSWRFFLETDENSTGGSEGKRNSVTVVCR
jgi:hypothetical protein